MLPYKEYLEELQKFPTSFRIGVELFRSPEGEMEVLLELRNEKDEFFVGRWALFGSTILMRENPDEFWKRFSENETGIQDSANAPSWVFCGILETPNTRRHHGMVQLFGRVWDKKPEVHRGTWFAFSRLDEIAIVPSELSEIDIVHDVLVKGKTPTHTTFTGTDE